MSLATELAVLARAEEAFYAPIIAYPGTLHGLTPDDPKILRRLCYNQAHQDILKDGIPYIVWKGPYNYDDGQCSVGSSGTKKEDFWIWCHHNSLTEANDWVESIVEGINDLNLGPTVYNLNHLRLTAAIILGKVSLEDDQTIRSAKEHPVSQSGVGYTFGYQRSGN